ncbi:MAG: cobyric acid synthase CobQ [Cyanobacteria bacterium P01_G01_bin.54]
MKAIMVVGTTSHAGKSMLTTALCRILHQRGWRLAPFKGQNMALNAYVTATGGEIGYAQAVQAWAAGIRPWVEMNPILLKPQGDMTSQVIIRGEAVGVTQAADYYEQYFQRGWQAITQSLQQLALEFDLVICEGAGSPAEVNLKHRDLTNMRVAEHLRAATILIVDIDRGGAFAHVVGTLALLTPEERSLIKGIVINKFRGQLSLLQSGIDWLEKDTGIPVLGVIPWTETFIPAEDSLSLLERRSAKVNPDSSIVVIRLPRIANFTDFEPLDAEPTVQLQYRTLEQDLGYPDAVILPGSKTTLRDLKALKSSGMAQKILDYIAGGGTVLGICGGFQMLGQTIADPKGLEGEAGEQTGLGLLPLNTQITPNKVARQRYCTAQYPQPGLTVKGYELHQGRTTIKATEDYLNLFDEAGLGIVDAAQSIWGCYLHSIFDNGPWRRTWLNHLRQRRGLSALPTGISHYSDQREDLLNQLAQVVDEHLDLTPILEAL